MFLSLLSAKQPSAALLKQNPSFQQDSLLLGSCSEWLLPHTEHLAWLLRRDVPLPCSATHTSGRGHTLNDGLSFFKRLGSLNTPGTNKQ